MKKTTEDSLAAAVPKYSSFRCLHDHLALRAERAPDAVAVAAPGRAPLTYAGLCSQVEDTVRCLNDLGLGHNDRVEIVLPNGPEMATAFLGVAAGVTAAPLNPYEDVCIWRWLALEHRASDDVRGRATGTRPSIEWHGGMEEGTRAWTNKKSSPPTRS